METILISDFKAKAIATLKRVRDTGQPVLVTLRGEPVAEIVPPPAQRKRPIVLGSGRELSVRHIDDKRLVAEGFADEWEMNQ